MTSATVRARSQLERLPADPRCHDLLRLDGEKIARSGRSSHLAFDDLARNGRNPRGAIAADRPLPNVRGAEDTVRPGRGAHQDGTGPSSESGGASARRFGKDSRLLTMTRLPTLIHFFGGSAGELRVFVSSCEILSAQIASPITRFYSHQGGSRRGAEEERREESKGKHLWVSAGEFFPSSLIGNSDEPKFHTKARRHEGLPSN